MPYSISAQSAATKAILCAFAISLIACNHYTIAKLAVFHPATSHVTLLRFIEALRQESLFGTVDALLISSVLILALTLIAIEWRSQSLSMFLRELVQRENTARFFLIVSSLISVRYYFAPGPLHWAGDAAQHIVYVKLTAHQFALGHIPTWTFAIGNGSPFLQNYGPLFFYIAGLFTLVLQNLDWGIKITLAGAHVLSAFGTYCFVRHLCNSRRAALFAGLVYGLSFWHVQQVLLMGRLPLGLFYAILPWGFWSIERMASPERRLQAAVGGAVAIASLFFSHPGYAAYATLFTVFYSGMRLWEWRKHNDIKTRAICTLALLCGGGLLSTYMTLGMWIERVYTNMHSMRFGIGHTALQSVPDPSWQHILVWSNFRFWLSYSGDFHWYGGYLGIVPLLIALTASVFALRTRRYAGVILCLLLSFWIVFAYRIPPVSTLQFIQNMNAARYLLFACFFISAAAGIGAHVIALNTRSRGWSFTPYALLFIALFIDLGSTTFIQPYKGEDKRFSNEGFVDVADATREYEQQGQLAPYRIIRFSSGSNYLNVAKTLHLSHVPTADAFHPGELRALGTFTRPFIEMAKRALNKLDRLEDITHLPEYPALQSGFSLLNTRHFVASLDGEENIFAIYSRPSPIIVAPSLQPYFEEDVDPLALIYSMEISPTEARSQRIFARNIPAAIHLDPSPKVTVLSHQVFGERVTLRVHVDRACFARLAYAYFPYYQLKVDGRVTPFYETAGRFVGLHLSGGEHLIELEAGLSPLRIILLSVSAAFLITTVVFLWRRSVATAIKST